MIQAFYAIDREKSHTQLATSTASSSQTNVPGIVCSHDTVISTEKNIGKNATPTACAQVERILSKVSRW